MSPINERQWQGRVLLRLAQLIAEHPEWGITRVEQEVEVTVGGRRRRYTDPLLFDDANRPLCLLELKLPDRPEGRSPRYLPVVEATFEKASYLATPFWLTWNVNSAVLWKLDLPGRAPYERSIRQYDVTAIRSSDDLDRADVTGHVDAFLERLLSDLHELHVGIAAAVPQPLDESIVHTIETYLDPLLVGVLEQEVLRRYRRQPRFAAALRAWAVDDQGWTWDDSPQGLPESLARTVRLACSMLVNKLVFYEAMRKRYGLRSITVPTTITTGADLGTRLQRYFDEILTNIDYESIFTRELIDDIPFMADAAVELWRDLIRDFGRVDFTHLDYEVIGSIFQRLIAPDERHKLGQYFTPSRVVDFINAFCIRDADASVFDPGCGAGTFLVRAYARLRALHPEERHEDRLLRLWGADIARYAAHLSVINLAVRDLSSGESYPRVIHDDFFNMIPHASEYPFHERIHRGPTVRTVQVLEPVPEFGAVVGNPPYTRQEEMEDLFAGMKARAHARVLGDWGIEISQRAGIHALFLLHGAAFLAEGGRLGFLTHSSWVDVNYGRDLQRFLLERFKIIAIVEPQVEHWFPGVDVNTSIVVVERCANAAARAAHPARFVQVRVPLAQLVTREGGDPDRSESYDRLVAAIEAAPAVIDTAEWRILSIRQDELWRRGLNADGQYVGAKWGVYLRAPDVYFAVLERAADRLVRLDPDLARVRFALKSGANEFFYVRDVTTNLTLDQLRDHGLTRRDTSRLRVIQTEDGERHVVEADYLRPIVISTRQVSGLRVDPAWALDSVLMVTDQPPTLAGTHVRRYIREGERRAFGTGPRSGIPAQKPTCAARSPWYALDPTNRGRFWWFMNITDIFAVPYNPEDVYADHRFHNITLRNLDDEPVVFGLLNGTFTLLCAEVLGRQFAGRGIDSLDIQVTEVKDFPILDPQRIPPRLVTRISEAVTAISRRSLLAIPEELAQTDRQELDDAILDAMGFDDPAERARVRDAIYEAVRERLRIRFARARSTQSAGPQRRQTSAADLAVELAGQIDPNRIRRFPDDFVPAGVRGVAVTIPDGTHEVTREGMTTMRVGTVRIDLPSSEAVNFVELAAAAGARGQITVPSDGRVLERALGGYREYTQMMEAIIGELADSRTRDRRLRRQIRAALRQHVGLGASNMHRQLRLIE